MTRFFYTLAMRLFLPYIAWRIFRRHRSAVPWREYFGFCPLAGGGGADDAPLVWIHTVSVGEAAAAAEMTKQLGDNGCRLLLTHTTAAGGAWLRHHHPQAAVAALPLDFPGAARRFLRRAKPALGVIVEAEYWPNLLIEAKNSGVKLMLANARLGAKNARRYAKIGNLIRRAIGSFDIITAQTARDAGRLRCYGARRVITAGNLKFDRPLTPLERRRVRDKPTVLVAATRRGEEDMILSAMDEKFRRRFFTILAPRHPARRNEITALLHRHGIPYARRGGGDTVRDDTDVYLADTMGEMALWYAACDAAIIGGSFLPYGGQNPIEAMRAGVPSVIGPYTDNYVRLVRRAVKAGVLAQEATAEAAVRRLAKLAAERGGKTGARAQAFCEKERGALAKNMALAGELLERKPA